MPTLTDSKAMRDPAASAALSEESQLSAKLKTKTNSEMQGFIDEEEEFRCSSVSGHQLQCSTLTSNLPAQQWRHLEPNLLR